MTTTKDRSQLPETALFGADLIERLGFSWVLDFEYPTPEDVRRRLQIRTEKHYAPQEMVTKYAHSMLRKEKFAPIVMSKDGYIIDGNTRVEAVKKNKFPYVHAFVIQENYEDAKPHVHQRLHALGAGFNARNGNNIDRGEIRRAVKLIGENPDFTATRIAALIGVTESSVCAFLAEQRAKDRAEKLGIVLNGTLTATALRNLGKVGEKLNDEPFKKLAALASDTGMQAKDINVLAKQMKDEKSDYGAMEILNKEREARRDQIAMYTASGKSKPSISSQLRQRFGWILKQKVESLVEHNPNLTQDHYKQTQAVVELFTAVLQFQSSVLEIDAK